MSIEVASIAFVLPQRPLVRGNPNTPIPKNGSKPPVRWQRKTSKISIVVELQNAKNTEDIAYEKHPGTDHQIAILIRQLKGVFIMNITTQITNREFAPVQRKFCYVSNGGIGQRTGRVCV